MQGNRGGGYSYRTEGGPASQGTIRRFVFFFHPREKVGRRCLLLRYEISVESTVPAGGGRRKCLQLAGFRNPLGHRLRAL